MIIWTFAYRPFIMGGNVNGPVMAEIDVVSSPIQLDKGIVVYVVVSPNGKTFVVEGETGAIVGRTVEDVRADVEAASQEVMDKQIASARLTIAKADHISPDEFWKLLRAN